MNCRETAKETYHSLRRQELLPRQRFDEFAREHSPAFADGAIQPTLLDVVVGRKHANEVTLTEVQNCTVAVLVINHCSDILEDALQKGQNVYFI